MLDTIDLNQKIEKKEFKRIMPELQERLFRVQKRSWDAGVPVVIVFEGWDASGKGTSIQALTSPLDPRGFKLYPIRAARTHEKRRPWLWRYWNKLPARGEWAIFDRSWYGRVLVERLGGLIPESEWRRAYRDILDFERTIADDNYAIIKFFFHITKAEQKRRFEKLTKDPLNAWHVLPEDWEHHRNYDNWLLAYEEMLERTDSEWGPWTIVEATDRRFTQVKVFQTIVNTLEEKLGIPYTPQVTQETEVTAIEPGSPGAQPAELAHPADELPLLAGNILLEEEGANPQPAPELQAGEAPAENLTPGKGNSSGGWYAKHNRSLPGHGTDGIRKFLIPLQAALFHLGHQVYVQQRLVVIVFEGWNAAGIGGAIHRVTERLDPRGYVVYPPTAPMGDDLTHHYLWRTWRHLPEAGQIAIFDHSWYRRVLVERVEGLCREDEWKRAYREINQFEHQLVDFGAVLFKFWIHLSKDEQLRRFQERVNDQRRSWKVTEDDWRNRAQWEQYEAAANEMLLKTNTLVGPWTVVEGNSKFYARIKILKTMVDKLGQELQYDPFKNEPLGEKKKDKKKK